MIRTPELKKQAAMLALEVQAAMNAPLQHAAALEIVAKLYGFKNWRHAASVSAPAPEVTPTTLARPPATVELAIVFGSEDIAKLVNAADPQSLDTYEVKTFGTAAEKDAYLQGLTDMLGWEGFSDVTDDPVKQFLAEFAPGEDAVAIRAELTKMGFTRVGGAMRGADEEFNRDILDFASDDGTMDRAYQFIIFQRDASGARFINMDCALFSNGDYLTETSLFTGATVLEALQTALKSADTQRDEARKEALSLSESAH